MPHFFDKRDVWGHGMALWVLVALVALVPPAWWAIQQIDLENDVENWLPSEDPQAQIFAWYREHFPPEDRILVSWRGSSLEDPRVGRFAEALEGIPDSEGIHRGGLKEVDEVTTPHELIQRMADYGVDRKKAVQRLEGVLTGSGGSPVALAVSLSEAGLAEKPSALRAIREAAQEVGIGASDLAMGGPAVAGSALNQAVIKAAWNPEAPLWQLHKRSPILLSGLVGVVLAFLLLRSVRLATLVLMAAYYTVFLAVSVVPVTNGSMNMVLVVMPTLLFVLTVSAAIHVANYWKHAAHSNPQTAIVEAVRMARQPCTLASITTAIGLLSLTVSPLRPVRDFGLYSAVGCLIALGVVLFGLPALMQFWPAGAPTRKDADHSPWARLGDRLARFRTPITVSCLLAFAVCLAGLQWFRTETKVVRYFPEGSRLIQDYNFLENELSGIVPVDVIIRFDEAAQEEWNFLQRMEVVRDVQTSIRQHREISGALSLSDFQPVTEPPPSDAGFLQKARYHKRANEVETRIKEGRERGARSFLTAAGRSAAHPIQPEAYLSRTGDELWRITAQAAVMSEVNYGHLTSELNRIVGSELQNLNGTGYVVTGMVPLFLRTQEAVLEGLIRSFGLAFAVIAMVMMVVLRNPVAGLITMVPNLLPIGIVFGLLSWNGMATDIGTMITASVALGIAVDGTLHLLTWFRAGIREGLSRREAVSRGLMHCGPAMWQTGVAVGLGLLMLSAADLLLISRFGWLMASLIGMALVADVIFLPALLAGPLGRLIEKTVQRQPQDAPEEAAREEITQPIRTGKPAPHFHDSSAQHGEPMRMDQ